MPPQQPQSAEQRKVASWNPMTTHLSSRQLKSAWTQKVKDEALFSARTTYKAYVDSIKRRLAEVAAGTLVPKAAEERLQETLKDIGYDPARGFPGNKTVPSARPRSIEDLSSSRRIQLIIDTNVKRARSMGQMAASEEPAMMLANPAWRLTRTGARKKPRGDWRRRWAEAGAACGWEGASRKQMVAAKDSPIWDRLGEGAGGYEDALGSSFPPFAFGSGMAWVNVSGREWRSICAAEGIDDGMARIEARAVEASRREDEAEGLRGPTDKEKAALRELLAKMKKRRSEREERTAPTMSDTPIPLPPYAKERPEPEDAAMARKSIGKARERIDAVKSRAERLYIPAIERMRAKAAKAVKDSGGEFSAKRELAAIDEAAASFREAVRRADEAVAATERYGRMLDMAAKDGEGGFVRFMRFASAAERAAEKVEEASKNFFYWENKASRAAESVARKAEAVRDE